MHDLTIGLTPLQGLTLSFTYYTTGRWKKKAVVKYEDNL
jgi:hypothetical protein